MNEQEYMEHLRFCTENGLISYEFHKRHPHYTVLKNVYQTLQEYINRLTEDNIYKLEFKAYELWFSQLNDVKK